MIHNSNEISVYIHWPFCLSLCPYCDFNSHVYGSIDEDIWKISYLKEIDYFAYKLKGKKINSIFFGGGTPSLMSPNLVASIIDKLASLGNISSFHPDSKNTARDIRLPRKTEITLEANPTSYESSKFKDFKKAGINRLSIGVQALNDRDLHKLGRKHSASEAIETINSAAKIFDNFSFDLIYARAGQTIPDWHNELKMALDLCNNHLSLYQLTIEKGTEFFNMYRSGGLVLPNEDESAGMYELTNQLLSQSSMHRYEISNYAKLADNSFNSENSEKNYCRHNMAYWRYEEYLGIGPGAHSRLHEGNYDINSLSSNIEATMMHHKPEKWLSSVKDNNNGIQKRYNLTSSEIIEETIMMGLRLSEGLFNSRFESITGKSIDEVINLGLAISYNKTGFIDLSYDSQDRVKNIKLTDKGLLLHSYLVSRLLS